MKWYETHWLLLCWSESRRKLSAFNFNWFFFKTTSISQLKVSPYQEISDKHLYSNNIFYLGYFISFILPVGNLDTQYLFADVFYFHLIPSIISLSDNPSKTKSSISSSIVYSSTYSLLCSRSHTPSNGKVWPRKKRFEREIFILFFWDKYFSPSNLATLYKLKFWLTVLTY